MPEGGSPGPARIMALEAPERARQTPDFDPHQRPARQNIGACFTLDQIGMRMDSGGIVLVCIVARIRCALDQSVR